MQSNYSKQLDKMVWSFSSVNCYNNCPKCFYLTYIEHQKKINNAFAEWGSFGHSILERYYKGKLELWDLLGTYEDEYRKNVKLKFPHNRYVDLGESYYAAGKKYFANFEGDFQDCEILGVEQKVQLNINGYNFIGYIDLLVRSPEGIIVCDHKSKSKFTSKKEKMEFLRQLYLYSLYVKETYGEYPTKLMFNMFRVGKWEEEAFDKQALDDAVKWFTDTIKSIYADTNFKDKIATAYKSQNKKLKDFRKDDFFCNELCSTPCLRSKRYKRK